MNIVIIAVAAACVPAALFAIVAFRTDAKERREGLERVRKAEISKVSQEGRKTLLDSLLGAYKALKNASPILRGASTIEGLTLLQLSACIQRLKRGEDVPVEIVFRCLSQTPETYGFIEQIKGVGA